MEYDDNTGHLLWVTIRYNKREANKCVSDRRVLPRATLSVCLSCSSCVHGCCRKRVLSAFELKNRVALELQDAGVFADGFTFVEAAKA